MRGRLIAGLALLLLLLLVIALYRGCRLGGNPSGQEAQHRPPPAQQLRSHDRPGTHWARASASAPRLLFRETMW